MLFHGESYRLTPQKSWHLGQIFYKVNRAAEHDASYGCGPRAGGSRRADVAGDIFLIPARIYARELYNRFVVQLQQTGCRLVLAGNHDSVAMLNESRDILAFLHTTVVANAGYAPIELPLRDGTPGAIFCPVPFLRPRELVTSQAGHSGREKQQQLRHRRRLSEQYQQACALRGDRPLPIIASGHLTTVGASKSDAVRDIYIGTLDAFPAQHFPPADYIALGHIHRAQMVGGCEHIRYSGSPLPLSFDETGKAKSVHLVSFSEGDSAMETRGCPWPAAGGNQRRSGRHHRPAGAVARRRAGPAGVAGYRNHHRGLSARYSAAYSGTDGGSAGGSAAGAPQPRAAREKTAQHSRTLSELKVEEVFERRLALTEIDDMKRARLHELFAHTVHTLTAEDENA